MANSDDDSTSTSSSSSSSSSSSTSSSSSSSSSKETSASSSPTDDQPSSLAGGAIKAEDGHSDVNNSEEEGTQPHATRQGPISKRGGRIRGGQKKRPRSDKRDEDQNEDEDSDSDSAIIFDEVHTSTSTADLPTKKPSRRPRRAKDQQSADDVDVDVDTFCSNSPTTQYWSDQAKGPSGDGTIFEGMNQLAVADIVGWSHAIGGGNGSRLQLNGGRSDIPIPPWGLSLHQPPPFQPMHSEAAPMSSEVPPPPQLLGLLLKCAERKMSKSAERVRNGPQNADQEQKMKVMRHMNNMFDSSALIAAGVAVEEILTSALLPLAAAHVSRCRAMDHQARIISDRGRKQSTGDKKYPAPTMSSDMRTTTKKSQGKSNRSPKKGGKESDDEEKESVDDVVALDRDAFDAWTLPPFEALLQLAKTRKDEKGFRSKSAGRSNTSFLPSATPTSEAIQQAIASAGSDQTQIQMNTDAAYDRSAAKWCQHHSLDSEMVQERMDDLFGLFLPKEPP